MTEHSETSENRDRLASDARTTEFEVDDILKTVVDLIPEARRRDFDAAGWFAKWILIPQPALGGRSPSELLGTPTDRELVRRLIGSLGSGAYL